MSRQIATLTTLGRFMPNFWTSDAEMLSVALMSDPGSNTIGKGKTKEGEKVPWAKQRLGQTMILLEVIVNLRTYQKGIGMKHSESTVRSGPDDLNMQMTDILIVRVQAWLFKKL